jgi:transposase-like protein
MDDLFKDRHFDREVIVFCVWWYLRHKLGLQDLVDETYVNIEGRWTYLYRASDKK